jgi:hypothetical protein
MSNASGITCGRRPAGNYPGQTNLGRAMYRSQAPESAAADRWMPPLGRFARAEEFPDNPSEKRHGVLKHLKVVVVVSSLTAMKRIVPNCIQDVQNLPRQFVSYVRITQVASILFEQLGVYRAPHRVIDTSCIGHVQYTVQ